MDGNSSQESGGATYETMTWNEKKNLLLQICGVVSEHTKKLCTRFVVEPTTRIILFITYGYISVPRKLFPRSTRCPQHTEEQRKSLRSAVLDPATEHGAEGAPPLAPHDVGSPPDSSPSSSCSSSSRKRDKHRSKNSKNAKREKLNHSPGRE